MKSPAWIDQLLNDLPSNVVKKSDRKRLLNLIKERYEEEISTPPSIAIIGSAGVGKSSTINALFGTDLPVSHVRTGTRSPVKISIDRKGKLIKGAKGDILIYDMPGVGEDFERDETYKEAYRSVLTKCEVAVWLVQAGDRRFTYDQMIIKDVVNTSNEDIASRIVIGINKIDQINPKDWDKEANLPSKRQVENIAENVNFVLESFAKVCPGLVKDRIVAYSAEQRYRLTHLFNAMLTAYPLERVWVLNSRKKLADYWELVDAELREEARSLIKGAE